MGKLMHLTSMWGKSPFKSHCICHTPSVFSSRVLTVKFDMAARKTRCSCLNSSCKWPIMRSAFLESIPNLAKTGAGNLPQTKRGKTLRPFSPWIFFFASSNDWIWNRRDISRPIIPSGNNFILTPCWTIYPCGIILIRMMSPSWLLLKIH